MKSAFAFLTSLLVAGCANVMYHSDGLDARPAGVYRGTREGSMAVAQIFTEVPAWHGGSSAEASYAHAMCVLLSPFLIVDWPLEVVADTLTFPYDICKEALE